MCQDKTKYFNRILFNNKEFLYIKKYINISKNELNKIKYTL